MNRILSIGKLDRYGRETGPCLDQNSEEAAPEHLKGGRRPASGRVRVTMESEESFIISERKARSLGLRVGEELTSERYEEILKMFRTSCMQRCGTLLGSRDYSVHRLRSKLAEAGFPASVIEECIGKLSEARYLDDRRYAETYVRSHLRDRSSLRIRRDLMERGIAENYIEEAFSAIAEEADPDEAQIDQIRRLLDKRRFDPDLADYIEKQKTMAFLQRKGYTPDLIRRAMTGDRN